MVCHLPLLLEVLSHSLTLWFGVCVCGTTLGEVVSRILVATYSNVAVTLLVD